MSRLLWGVIAPAAIVLPLAIAAVRLKHLQKPLRLFMYYLLFGGSINLVAVLLAGKGINNMPLGHLFTIGEAMFLLCFYYGLTNNAQTRRWLTISAGLFRGLDRVASTRMAFLLGIPALVGAAVFELKDALNGHIGVVPLLVGTVVSFIVGYASVAWLIRFVAKHSTSIFALYRVLLGVVILILLATSTITAT